MVQENEVVMLLLGVGMLIFILANRKRLDLPSIGLLLAGYYLLLAGWLLTVLEGLFWGETLNLVEHSFYAASAVLNAAWCWRVFGCQGAGR
ncbi:MAG: hypothetical protein JXA78_16735 [Anaerolineales bacterium]|nr:hypothetical protein [Anaerolineales bacterium]